MATARNARTLDEAPRRGCTPDGDASPAAARGRSDDDDENTTTSSASSPPCFRDATTTLGVALANVDGGEHDGGDDNLALDAHHIPLMTARNGAESRPLGLLAALEPLDDNAGSAISPEARDMKSDASRLASIEDFHRDDDLLGAVASALDASKHAHELAPVPPAHSASGSHLHAAKFTSDGAAGLIPDTALIAAAMGNESDAMLRQSDEDAPGAVRRDDCSTMDTASGAKTKTEKNVS